jgi:hypothetical protein
MMNAVVVLALSLVAADWDNLKEITRDTTYRIVFRDGRCLKGNLISSNGQQVVLTSGAAQRADVLRIQDVGPYIVSSVPVYSGRSSWADVKAAGAGNLLVVTKRGEQRRLEWPEILDARIIFNGETLEKVDVGTVSYIRFRPLTSREEYVHHENVDLLAPRLWFKGLLLGKISVKLYDSAMAEDNSKLGCR